jgi:tetratricopeptide (TPR) repeat protein
MGNYDSAFHFFELPMQMADALNSEVWKGIISGNKGYTYFLQKKYAAAKPLLEFDFRTSKQHDEIADAAHALQIIARINLLLGKKDSALLQVKEALSMLQARTGTNTLFPSEMCITPLPTYIGYWVTAIAFIATFNYTTTCMILSSGLLQTAAWKLPGLD